jgi:putative ABC transport system permease protein
MITKFVKGALRDILANKMRSFLTVLGILIGISSVTMMVSIGGAAQVYIDQSITSRLGKNLVIVQPGQQSSSGGPNISFSAILSSLTDEEYEAVKELEPEYVTYVSRRQLASAKVNFVGDEEDILLYVVDPGFFKTIDIQLFEGRYFRLGADNSQEVMISKTLAKRLFKLQNPIGQDITLNNREFRVIGVVDSLAEAAFGSETYEAFIDTRTYRDTFSKPEQVSAILMTAKDDTQIDALKQQLDRVLRRVQDLSADDKADFSITTQGDIIETSATILNTVTLFITVISAISLLVGGIGVMNIMLVSVKERVKEFGLRKAIGATNQDIQVQILVESVLFSLIGGILGIMLGALGALGIERLGGLPLYISSSAVITSLAVSSLVGIVFGLYPAIQAGKLSPIEALRSN